MKILQQSVEYKRGGFVQHDNAPAHTSQIATNAVHHENIPI